MSTKSHPTAAARRAPGSAPAPARASAAKARPLSLQLDADNTHLSNLCGPLDENLRQIDQAYGVEIGRRGTRFTIRGAQTRPAAGALRWFHERAASAPLFFFSTEARSMARS